LVAFFFSAVVHGLVVVEPCRDSPLPAGRTLSGSGQQPDAHILLSARSGCAFFMLVATPLGSCVSLATPFSWFLLPLPPLRLLKTRDERAHILFLSLLRDDFFPPIP